MVGVDTVVIDSFVQNPSYVAYEGQTWAISWPSPYPDPGLPCNVNIDRTLYGEVKLVQDQQLGWYSWKVVVKQTEQEYYNVYLPGSLAGYPCDQEGADAGSPEGFPTVEFDFPVGQYTDTAHVVLFGDNINKIPRDLTEVGPTQQKFRSSVRLFGRVENFVDPIGGANDSWSSRQYDPGTKWDIAVSVGKMSELGLGDLNKNPVDKTIPPLFYQGTTDPLIARVKTQNEFGQQQRCTGGDVYTYGPCLAVYETAPVESKLEIFWETTTSGLISELNENILNTDNTIPTGLTSTGIIWPESYGYGAYISNTFEAADSYGNGLGPTCEIELVQVTRADGFDASLQFELEEQGVGTGEYQIKIAPHNFSTNPGFLCWEDVSKNSFTFLFNITRDDGISPIVTIAASAIGTVFNETPVPRSQENHGDQLKTNIYNNWAVMYTDTELPIIRPYNVTPCCWPYPAYQCSSADGIAAYGKINTTDVHGGAYRWLNMESTSIVGGLSSKTYFRNRLDSEATNTYQPGSTCQPYCGWNCEAACTQKNQTTDFPWAVFDGVFRAASGTYGSVPIWPPSSYIGNEIVYSIPRMYQVSMIGEAPFWVGSAPTCNIVEVIFGVEYTTSTAGLAWRGSDDSLIPSGPIYWDFDPTGNQLNLAQGGEEIVGQRYNGPPGSWVHYWKDIEDIITLQNPAWVPGTVAGAPAAVTLQQGYNSFYCPNGAGVDLFGVPLGPPNAGGYGGYLGGIDGNGMGPSEGLMKFFPVTEPLVTGSNGITETRAGYINAGNPAYAAESFVGEVGSPSLTGNTIPGGRYVVTLRATDRTSISPANPSGSYYEWDVPITICGWNTHGQMCFDLNNPPCE